MMGKSKKTIMVLYDNCISDSGAVNSEWPKRRICHLTPLALHQESPLFRWGLIQNETLWIIHNRFPVYRSTDSDAVDRHFSTKP